MKKSLNCLKTISIFVSIIILGIGFSIKSLELALDTDIIGAYKVMVGKPILGTDYIYYKSLKDTYKWSLGQLGRYLLSLEEAKNI